MTTAKREGTEFRPTEHGDLVLGVRRDTASAGTGVADGDYAALSVDSAGRLHSRAHVAPPSAIYHGQNTVASAGTEEPLAASQALTQGVWVKALNGNTGIVYVGDSTVSSADGFELSAGESVFIPTDNLANVSIDAATTSDGVSYLGF